MLLSKDVTLKWNSKIKKHYVDLGYKYTKMGDEFIVNVNDLTNSSTAMVKIKCDYCNDTVFFKPWRRYYTENIKGTIHKDACDKCKTKKAIESNKIVYGCENVFQLDEVKNKMKETNLKNMVAIILQNLNQLRRKLSKHIIENMAVNRLCKRMK